MAFIILALKGFLIGIAFIIPGVSGGTVAIYLGVYDKLLHAIGNVFKEFKKSLAFLIPIFIGIAISVVALAKLIGLLLDWNSLVTLMLFIGLIAGGIPSLWKKLGVKPFKASTIIAFLISFLLVLMLFIGKSVGSEASVTQFPMNAANFILILLLGMISSMTMIVPGISGSALLMTLGFYSAIVTTVIGNVLDFTLIGYNLFVILPFAVGVAIGIILFSKVIEYLLRKHKVTTFAAIIGFVMASAIVIFLEIRDPGTASVYTEQTPIYLGLLTYIKSNIISTVLGIVALAAGFIVAYKFVAIEETPKQDEN